MRRSKFLLILAFGFLLFSGYDSALAAPHAGNLSYAYGAGQWGDPGFYEYWNRRSLETLDQVPLKLRAFAIADLVNNQDSEDLNDHDAFYVPDREAMMLKYYENADPKFKAEVNALAFQLAIARQDSLLANRLYEGALKENPELAQEYICGALATVARDPNKKQYHFHEGSLKYAKNAVGLLAPLIAKRPYLAGRYCDLKSGDTSLALTIGQFVSIATQTQQTAEAQQTLLREYSSCSPRQIELLMWEVIEKQMRFSRASQTLINYNYDKCSVRGVVRKIPSKDKDTPLEFEFLPEYSSGGAKPTPLKFKTYQEISQILKARPQNFLIPSSRPALPSPAPSTQTPESNVPKDLWENIKKNPWGALRDQVKSMGSGAK